jgi:hypothetical protein
MEGRAAVIGDAMVLERNPDRMGKALTVVNTEEAVAQIAELDSRRYIEHRCIISAKGLFR